MLQLNTKGAGQIGGVCWRRRFAASFWNHTIGFGVLTASGLALRGLLPVGAANAPWHANLCPIGVVFVAAGSWVIARIGSGAGWVQEEGGEKRHIRPGDVVLDTWHGATDKNGVSHVAVSNVKGRTASRSPRILDECLFDREHTLRRYLF